MKRVLLYQQSGFIRLGFYYSQAQGVTHGHGHDQSIQNLESKEFRFTVIANLCIGLCTPPVGTCLEKQTRQTLCKVCRALDS